eukprot:m.5824 g.5824  ORF g.5824 m.5824 type:complete len:73 (+) comp5094_c0_seq1:443-661(+)
MGPFLQCRLYFYNGGGAKFFTVFVDAYNTLIRAPATSDATHIDPSAPTAAQVYAHPVDPLKVFQTQQHDKDS